MKYPLSLVLVSGIACLSNGAIASAKLPQFNQVELGYIQLDLDNLETGQSVRTVESNGISIDARYLLSDSWYITAGAIQTAKDYYSDNTFVGNSTTTERIVDEDYKYGQQHLGVGYLYRYSDELRFFADVSYLRRKVTLDLNQSTVRSNSQNGTPVDEQRSSFTFNGTLHGTMLRAGAEYALSENLFLSGVLYYERTRGDGFTRNDTGLELGANYRLSENWTLYSSFKFSDDSATKVGFKYSF